MLRIGIASKRSRQITDWTRVHELSRRHKLVYQRQRRRKNCAFIRIGRMLQEIGVLPPTQDAHSIAIQNHLHAFDPRSRRVVEDYLERLRQKRLLPKTQVFHLIVLKQTERYLKDRGSGQSVLDLTAPVFQEYLHFRLSEISDPSTFTSRFYQIREFYRWALFKKHIAFDPTAGVQWHRPVLRLSVCSDEQVAKLVSFARNRNSDPRLAMLVTLPLLFGLTAEKLRFARVEIHDDTLRLHFRKKPQSAGMVYAARDPHLNLPQEPTWILDLQKRFHADWTQRLRETRASRPVPWLFPAGNQRSTVPCSYSMLRKLLRQATLAATGTDIPIRVLQKTCGHIFTLESDASLLTRIGWAPSTAFKYTWCPRRIFSRPAPKSSRT